ncbi:type IV secretory system conjugative DNA transfer family protein [Microbacterium sp. LRZ72]|uniref:type IV secretory system conjugative DNA transfer family protein n=1 Tax=Microbacterium sp. LRZ72 TaxID=2942481 RepID=UPI0029C07914|nr:type IV secretory system conjugative DNA transfer family protein [Microbacterium sp. LRZ72]
MPLLGWPLGDRNYAGVNPIHPRRLAAPKAVSSDVSVFAVGTAPGPDRPIGFPPRDRLQHLVVLGPTGSGKSQALEHLVLSDIEAGRACVVIEPKRQLVDAILDHLPASAAGNVVVLDAADEQPVGFNPLDIGDRDPDIAMDGVLAALQAVFEDGWGPRTEYLIQGSLLSLARAGVARGAPYTLVDLPTLLTEARFRQSVTKHVTADPTLATFWAEFEELRPGQRAAMIAAPLNKLRKLVLRKNLVAILGQSQPRFRLRDVFREGKTVLVPLNESLIGSGASRFLGSLVVAEIWLATLERAAEKDPKSRPGIVIVDEVQNYLHLPTSIGDALATSRSYGVAWHLAHQFREQLPRAMRSAFDVNARSKICFALTRDDARDLANQTRTLAAEDFESLGKYEIYAQLMVDGAPGGWFSARTLPPPPSLGASELIRQASRDAFGARDTTDREPKEPASDRVDQAPKRSRGQRARRS